MGNRDLVRKHRACAIMKSSEYFDFSSDGGNSFVVKPGREMTTHSSGPDLRVYIEYIGTKMQIDLLKHALKRTFTFLVHRESGVNLACDDRSEIERAIPKHNRRTLYSLTYRSRQIADIFKQIGIKPGQVGSILKCLSNSFQAGNYCRASVSLPR